MKSRNKGFTLVELSIVLVIIGLIIAGVTAGQSLVKGAQLRALKASGKDADRKEFETVIKKKAEARYEEALKELADQLKIKTSDLLLNADAS